jgi:N-methylhydantoinase A
VPLPEDLTLSGAVTRFHERHTAIYGHSDASAAVRLMTARVQVVGVTAKPQLGQIAADGLGVAAAELQSREVRENGSTVLAQVLTRSALRPGDCIRGPVIIEQYDTTTYVPNGFEVAVDPWLNLIGEKL